MAKSSQMLFSWATQPIRSAYAALKQPWWSAMKLNTEQIAERRRSREALGDQNYLWCWQHRGFW